jgi:hypothetical protein
VFLNGEAIPSPDAEGNRIPTCRIRRRDHLVRAAVPFYLGRVASFAAEGAGLEPSQAEDLCRRFERSRDDLVALRTAPAR